MTTKFICSDCRLKFEAVPEIVVDYFAEGDLHMADCPACGARMYKHVRRGIRVGI